MLLKRNNKQGIDVVVVYRDDIEGTNDPLSPNFVIPEWLLEKPTPWNIVAYFDECLQELVEDGQPRQLMGDYRRELRPAKKLLGEVDLETAVRAIRLTANETFGKVTLHRVFDRVPKIQRRNTTD